MGNFRRIVKGWGLSLCTLICAIFMMVCPMMDRPLQSAYAYESTEDFESFKSALMDMTMGRKGDKVVLDKSEYRVENGQVLVSEKAIQKYDLTKTDTGIQAVSNFENSTNDIKSGENFYAVDDVEEKDGQVVVDSCINRLIVNSSSKVDDFGAIAVAEYKDWHIFQYSNHEQAENAYQNFCNSNIKVSFDFVVSASDPVDEEEETFSNAANSHNSWGASYVGYDNFVDTTLKMYSQKELPEVVVAVIDSGIYRDHQLFAGRILTQYAENFSNDDTKTLDYDYQDLYGHGTHVSGTIAEFTLSNVKILPLKALNKEGKGFGSMIVAALEKAVDLKQAGLNIKVANMSLGIDLAKSELLSGYTDLTIAVQNAKRNGIVSVVSAGNESRDTRYSSPASIHEAFTVSALQQVTNQIGGYTIQFDRSYSNYGSHVDFAAPGSHIKSASNLAPNAYVHMSGTSMAAPHVSAAVALVYSSPSLADSSVDQVYNLLCDNAVDLGDEGWDDLYGYGLINIEKIGFTQVGNVAFSENSKIQTQKFNLTLSYVQDENVEIYYTFGNADVVDETNGQLYDGPIEISQTTKVTAMGYLKNFEKKVLQKSYVSSMTYYFDNFDLLSNYEFKAVGSGYEISNYLGTDLTTLNVPRTYNSRSVVGVGAYAFSNSKVEILNLPQNIRYFDSSAFSSDSALKEIHCSSSAIEVRSYAFYKCSNLKEFDVPNVTSVGSYAFAYCTNLSSLDLMQAKKIGYYAISGSGIKDLYVGDGVLIDEQNNLSLNCVHGFGGTVSAMSDAEKLAKDCDGEFEDLTLKITSDLNSTIIVKNGESANFGMTYSGYDVKHTIFMNGLVQSGRNVVVQIVGDGLEKWAMFKVSGLVNENNSFKVSLQDAFGNVVESREMNITVVSDEQSTFSLKQSGQNYVISIANEDGELVTDSANFYKSSNYTIEITPEDGYVLDEVKVNGQKLASDKIDRNYARIDLESVTSDVEIEILTSPKENLAVEFEIRQGGNVFVDEQIVTEQTTVERNESLRFKVVALDGYELRRVLLDGQILEEIAPNEYLLQNITKDLKVLVMFDEITRKVTVSRGKGGNLSTNGGIEDDIAYGELREYHITANDGYAIDYVTVNGKSVEVKNGTFVLEGKLEDYSIVVSFKKNEQSIFASGSVGLVYFSIFLAILFVFILAKIILSAVRRKQKKNNRNLR